VTAALADALSPTWPLLPRAADRIRDAGAPWVGLGSGNGAAYVWPGVPTNLPGAVVFFERTGWLLRDDTDDLVLDLHGYSTPAAVLAFVEREFPHWLRHSPIPRPATCWRPPCRQTAWSAR